MPAPCWALPWALRLNTETNNARSLPLVSSQSGVSHTAMTSKCLRVAEGMVSQGTPPPPPTICFRLDHVLGPGRRRRAEGESQELAGLDLVPGCRGQPWEAGPSPARERDTEL